jgi:hypothetical protein
MKRFANRVPSLVALIFLLSACSQEQGGRARVQAGFFNAWVVAAVSDLSIHVECMYAGCKPAESYSPDAVRARVAASREAVMEAYRKAVPLSLLR